MLNNRLMASVLTVNFRIEILQENLSRKIITHYAHIRIIKVTFIHSFVCIHKYQFASSLF